VMDVRWIGRFFDERDVFVRLVLLDLSGLGYLLFGPGGPDRPPAQWWLAGTAFTVVLVLYRLPLVSALTQAALLGVAYVLIDDATIHHVGAAWTLLELAIRTRSAARLGTVAGVIAAAHLVDGTVIHPGRLAHAVLGAATMIGVPILLGMLVHSSRELARQTEERAAEERRRRESEARMAIIQERGAVARELHDVVAHHVASMVLRVGVARHVLPDVDPRVAEVFDDVHRTGTAALEELRRLVALLRGPDGLRPDAAATAIELDALPAAIEAVVENLRRTGLTIDAEIAPEIGTLDAVRGLTVLRLTQEALTNVAKHAGPTARARLTVSLQDGDVHVEVVDDGGTGGGRGGDAADALTGGGHGLTGMRERVDLFGGRFEAGPSGTGWRVAAVLPAVPVGEGDSA